ncbi:alpha/beta fold hydrolase [Nonomuraea jabiensis]|uniref:alpha/beta fold hydrolase n=1 Tax=Nonomuraea jabiensis TaxID=882448 RepID=UPI0035E41FAE
MFGRIRRRPSVPPARPPRVGRPPGRTRKKIMTAATTHQSHMTSTDGTEIAVTVTGQGRPLVVSAGALNAAQDWQILADLLAPHFTTYAIDRRGRGASGDNSEHTIQREADDIAAVLELAGPDAILLGHSYGGLVTLAHALHQPPGGAHPLRAPDPAGRPRRRRRSRPLRGGRPGRRPRPGPHPRAAELPEVPRRGHRGVPPDPVLGHPRVHDPDVGSRDARDGQLRR